MVNTILTEIAGYIPTILATVITIITGWAGLKLKNWINTETKKDVVKTTVKYIEQVYKDIHGEEKLKVASDNVKKLLKEKGLDITDLELRAFIESAVRELNDSYKGGNKQ